MNSAPHLLAEDRPEFERVLDEVLRTAHARPGLAELWHGRSGEQLRAMALSAAGPIASSAAPEYQRYTSLREELRRMPEAAAEAGDGTTGPDSHSDSDSGSGFDPDGGTAGTPPSTAASAAAETGVGPGREGAAGLGLAGVVSAGLGDTAGAGAIAVVSVLAPVLAGAAAVIFLLVGYAMHLLTPEPALAGSMRSAGWAFAVLAAATALAGMGGLLFAAVRNGARSKPGSGRPSGMRAKAPAAGAEPSPGGLAGAVAEARADWREALLERGVVPFLQEALTDRQGAVTVADPHLLDDHRTPRLGYSHPDYSSPASHGTGDLTTRPRYSSPDYSSPDFHGPSYGRPDYEGPG
ncbi:hypothetical protein LHJ74_04970 [Streptomyces sp. N2-109]|uniref:Transmembrane protein n=1 Tax=Streptomyces gossypii TaxID=2883101 RepID=A0ABT2JN40_9ACTN|nr:hypothetical protein [Streptomyces gossypii]MCT2589290.1 hypothetical protein [Streptomyces gossypii]